MNVTPNGVVSFHDCGEIQYRTDSGKILAWFKPYHKTGRIHIFHITEDDLVGIPYETLPYIGGFIISSALGWTKVRRLLEVAERRTSTR